VVNTPSADSDADTVGARNTALNAVSSSVSSVSNTLSSHTSASSVHGANGAIVGQGDLNAGTLPASFSSVAAGTTTVDANGVNTNKLSTDNLAAKIDGRPVLAAPTRAVYDAYAYLALLSDRTIALNRSTFTAGATPYARLIAPGLQYQRQLFVRDFAMAVRGRPEAFQPADIMNALASFAAVQNSTTGGMPSGVDRTGAAVGAYAYDDSYEFVDLIYSHYLQTGTTSAYTAYKSNITLALSYVPVQNHLVYIADADAPIIGWGFMDVEASSGYDLMTSVMRYRALMQLTVLAAASGETSNAAAYSAEAALMPSALKNYLWDSSVGLFRNATIKNSTQHNVPANALAVLQSGMLDATTSSTVVNTLIAHLSGITQDGQTRHMLDGEYWTNFQPGTPGWASAQGAYQNGGFWGAFSGWLSAAIATQDKAKADVLMLALAAKYRAYDNSVTPPEATNTVTSYAGSGLYTASAALPLEYFRDRLQSVAPVIPFVPNGSSGVGKQYDLQGPIGIAIDSLTSCAFVFTDLAVNGKRWGFGPGCGTGDVTKIGLYSYTDSKLMAVWGDTGSLDVFGAFSATSGSITGRLTLTGNGSLTDTFRWIDTNTGGKTWIMSPGAGSGDPTQNCLFNGTDNNSIACFSSDGHFAPQAGGSALKLACYLADGKTFGHATMSAGDISACQ
jgi:hypothetical protein